MGKEHGQSGFGRDGERGSASRGGSGARNPPKTTARGDLERKAGGSSTDDKVDEREMYFLILHALQNGPCRKSVKVLTKELESKKLLPAQYDWTGQKFHPSYQQLTRKYAHIPPNYLKTILGQGLHREPFQADTLLGLGGFSGTEHAQGKNATRPKEPKPRTCLHLLEQRAIDGKRISTEAWPAKELYKNLRKVKTLRGHSAAVFSVAYDRESRLIVTGSDDHLVKIWSAESAYLRHSLRGHEKDITDIAFHPENTMLVTASNDGTLRAWDLRTGHPTAVLMGHTKDVLCVTFSPCPDRPYVLSGGADGTCQLWNSDDFSIGCVSIELPIKKMKRSRGRSSGAASNAVPPPPPSRSVLESRNMGSGANGTNSTVSGSPLMSIEVLCVCFNPGGTRFLVAGTDYTAHLFQVLPRSPPSKPEVKYLTSLRGHTGGLYHVTFSCLGDKISTGSTDGTARIWRRDQGQTALRVPGRAKRPATSWSSTVLNMRSAASMSVHSGRPAPRATSTTVARSRRHLGFQEVTVDALVWTLDDEKVITTSSDHMIRVWNSDSGELMHTLDLHKNNVYVLSAHPFDKRILMSSSYDGKCAVWDLDSGNALHVFAPPDGSPEVQIDKHAIVDGQWAPNGLGFTVSDIKGFITLYGIGEGDLTALAPTEQFFRKDYAPLVRDEWGNVIDEHLRLPPHHIHPGPLCDAELNPYPPELQPGSVNVKSSHFPHDNNPRTASIVRAELIARAEEYRQREIQEEKRLAREIRQRARAEAIRRERRNRELHEAGASSRNRLSVSHGVQQFMDAVDSVEAPEESDSEPDDPEWTGEEEMRVTRAANRASQNQAGSSNREESRVESRLRRIRPHPLRDDNEDADFGEDSQADFNSVSLNQLDRASNQLVLNEVVSESVVDRSRRPPQSVQSLRARTDGDSDSASVLRGSQVGLAGSMPLQQNSMGSLDRRGEQISSVAFPREDQRSIVATESIGASEAAEGSRNHTFRENETTSIVHARSMFSSRSGSESPRNDDKSSGKTRKRPRRMVQQEADESPEAATTIEENGEIKRDEAARTTSLSRRSKRRPGRSSKAVSESGRLSFFGDEIGSWRMRPADCVEQKRNPLPDPRLRGESIPLSASAWLLSTVTKDSEYVPQVHDRIVYFPQGHQSQIEAEVENGIWNPDAANTTIESKDGRPLLFQIEKIEYRITQCIYTVNREKKQDLWDNVRNVARLFLKNLNEEPKLEEKLCYLNYYPVDSVPEYVVLESRVQAAQEKTWRTGDKFKMMFIDETKKSVYYNGKISAISPDMKSRPWNSMEVEWESENDPDHGAKMFVSPWELEPVIDDKKPRTATGEAIKVHELCDSIHVAVTHELQSSGQFHDLAEPFTKPVEELTSKFAYKDVVPCPITLNTWLGRLASRFYRHEASVLADLNLLRANAVAYAPYDNESAQRMKKLSAWLFKSVNQCRMRHSALDIVPLETTKSAEGAGGYNVSASANDETKRQVHPSWPPLRNEISVVAMPPPMPLGLEVQNPPRGENSTVSGAAAESTISYGGTKTTAAAVESADDEVWHSEDRHQKRTRNLD